MALLEIRAEWMFTLKDDAGAVLLRSSSFSSERACRDATATMRAAASIDDRYRPGRSKSGHYYFTLVDERGETIAISPMFADEDACARTMKELRRIGPRLWHTRTRS